MTLQTTYRRCGLAAVWLRLGFDWMKSVMFREATLSRQEHVVQATVAKVRIELGAM